MKNRFPIAIAVVGSLLSMPLVASAQTLPSPVMTPELQQEMTPDAAFERLRAGNARFAQGTLTTQDLQAEVALTSTGQYPYAIVLSCLDSRVPVELVFDQGIGDLFVGRVAGNIVDEHMLGSMEFGTAVAGAKLIVVLGHTHCGAVKGACDGVELGNVTSLVETIAPSVASAIPEGETCSSSNPAHVQAVADHNVVRTIEEIRERSSILAEREAAGQLRIVGGMYDLATGVVTFVEP